MRAETAESPAAGWARAGFGRFDVVMGAFAIVVAIVVAVAFPVFNLSTTWAGFPPLAAATGGLSVLLVFYAWRREPRFTAVLRTTIWAIVLSNLCLLPMYVPMRHAIPLADPLLARMDHGMGFDDGAVVTWVNAHPSVARSSNAIYETLNVLCVLSVIATSFVGQVARAHNILIAILVGVLVTIVVSYFFPAIGPWETSPFTATADQIHCGRVIRLLKEDGPYLVDMANPDPIIATPSWHVILAVLSALALVHVRFIGPFSTAWAALIVLSTLTTGWHYLTDVIAGVLVALGSHALASLYIAPRFGLSGAPQPASP